MSLSSQRLVRDHDFHNGRDGKVPHPPRDPFRQWQLLHRADNRRTQVDVPIRRLIASWFVTTLSIPRRPHSPEMQQQSKGRDGGAKERRAHARAAAGAAGEPLANGLNATPYALHNTHARLAWSSRIGILNRGQIVIGFTRKIQLSVRHSLPE